MTHPNSLANLLDKGVAHRFPKGNAPHNKGVPWSLEYREKMAKLHPARVDIACARCGIVFTVAPSTARTKKYCSQICYTEAQKNRVQRECTVCETGFDIAPSELAKGDRRGGKYGRFCSAKCQYKSQSGSGHPMWKVNRVVMQEARGFYRTSAWQTISATVRFRDDYTCQYCGRRGGRLNAHHCIPIRYGGGALDADNLVTTCNPCHRTEHRRIEKLAAAFLYS